MSLPGEQAGTSLASGVLVESKIFSFSLLRVDNRWIDNLNLSLSLSLLLFFLDSLPAVLFSEIFFT